jgi:hypothetical protein
MDFCKSHNPRNQPEVEIRGTRKDVDAIVNNLSAQVAVAGHYEHRFAKKLEKAKARMQREYDRAIEKIQEAADARVKAVEKTYEVKFLELHAESEKRLKHMEQRIRRQIMDELTSSQREGSGDGDTDTPDYIA